MQNSHTIIIQKRFENEILQKFTITSFVSSVLGLQCLSVITKNKKHSLKQVIPITYIHTEEKVCSCCYI